MRVFVVLVVVPLAALVVAEPTESRIKLLDRLGRRGTATLGTLPRANHGTTWKSDTCIDAFGIGVDLEEARKGGVRGMLPSAEPRTVWDNVNAVDAFSVFVEDKTDDVEYDPASGFTMGRLPRSEHATVWKKTDSLDAYSIFAEDDRTEVEEEEASHVVGQIPVVA
mmetsp:Transcript_26567/g.53321  ORF Transcript_26567/g.53321 Transcript_26567/m.53321 type:complete len:166 (+) Transcript_26567:87-584(+)